MSFIKLDDIISSLSPIYAHRKEVNGIVLLESLEEHIDRCKFYFEKILKQIDILAIIKRFAQTLEFHNSEAIYEWLCDLFYQMIIFHDVGKCNPNFQKNCMKIECVPESFEGLSGTEHSFLSAILYLDHFITKLNDDDRFNKKEKKKLSVIIWEHSYVIARHHSDLCSMDHYAESIESPEKKKLIQFLSDRDSFPYIRDQKKIIQVFQPYFSGKEMFSEKEVKQKYFYDRLLYSILVACDYHATTEFMQRTTIKELATTLSIDDFERSYQKSDLLKTIRDYEKAKYSETEKCFETITDINELRNEMFLDAERELYRHLDKDLFFLEAPTGSGKSNMALQSSFHLMKQHGRKLFYVYPFNTLIEQNKQTLSELFPDDKLKDQIVVMNSLTPIKEDENDQISLLNHQFFNYPMILTSHVNFFDLLFGSKKDSAFGFYQLTDSVIVLDEIQSYRNHIWTEIITMLKECASLMGMKIIIMSATLPDLELLTGKSEQSIHLIKNRDLYFQHPFFKDRVKVSYELLEKDKMTFEKLLQHIIEHKEDSQKVLVEFIKKDSAYTFYQMLLASPKIECDVQCITGDDSIYEREKILNSIKNGEMNDMILVSTQVVEAGVDIDMDIGYKNISLLDSEEQFLGRINRSCRKEGMAYFFYLDDWQKIYQNDFRKNKPFTLCDPSMQEILEKKQFYDYYNKIFELLRKNLNENTDNHGVKGFEEDIKELNFPGIAKRMRLIDDNDWKMDLFLCREIRFDDGSVLNGREIWNEYKEILQDQAMEYAKKQIKLSVIRSKFQYFVYSVRKDDTLIYNDKIGNLRCIFNGDDFFENGELNRKKFEESAGLFIDL